MKRTAVKRSTTPLKRSPMKRGTSKLGPGKKANTWNAHRAKLARVFGRNGIGECEARFKHSCYWDALLSFAHAEKRRNIKDDEQLATEVALVCAEAHAILDEKMSHDAMRLAVQTMIHARGWIPEYDRARQTLTGRVVVTSK